MRSENWLHEFIHSHHNLELIREIFLHFYILQLEDFSESQYRLLCDHLGHSLEVHKRWYRLRDSTVEMTKVANILLKDFQVDYNKWVTFVYNFDNGPECGYKSQWINCHSSSFSLVTFHHSRFKIYSWSWRYFNLKYLSRRSNFLMYNITRYFFIVHSVIPDDILRAANWINPCIQFA